MKPLSLTPSDLAKGRAIVLALVSGPRTSQRLANHSDFVFQFRGRQHRADRCFPVRVLAATTSLSPTRSGLAKGCETVPFALASESRTSQRFGQQAQSSAAELLGAARLSQAYRRPCSRFRKRPNASQTDQSPIADNGSCQSLGGPRR